MAQGTTYLKDTDARGLILWEEVICADCLAAHVKAVELRKGETRVRRPWSGPARECGFCADDLAPELREARS